VAQNAAELQQAVGRYSGVAGCTELPGAAAHFDPPPPPPGGALPGPIPMEESQRRVAQGGKAGPTGVAAGGDPAPGGHSEATVTAETAPDPHPAATAIPPLPQLPPLAPVPSAVGGLVTGAMPAAGRPAATPGQRRSKKAARRRDDEHDEDPMTAASGDAASERAPVHAGHDPNSDRLQAPLAARLDPDNPPGPPAGTRPQDRR
jgi:hypothetical protein